MATYHVRVALRGGETAVQVDHGLTAAGHPHLFLRASSSAAPALSDADPWPPGLAWSISDRLSSGGDAKGRVLAIWQELPGGDPVPLAVLAWHAHGTGPLYVLDAGYSSVLTGELGRELTAVLLDALLEIAEHSNSPVSSAWRQQLRWSQVALKHAPHGQRLLYQRENLRRALELRFTKHSAPPAAAAWTRGSWLGERSF
jgi:hypothetical protein